MEHLTSLSSCLVIHFLHQAGTPKALMHSGAMLSKSWAHKESSTPPWDTNPVEPKATQSFPMWHNFRGSEKYMSTHKLYPDIP